MKIAFSRYFRLALAGLAVFVVLVTAALYAANFRSRRRSEALLASLQGLRIGTSTLDEVHPILASYNARQNATTNCESAAATSYSIWVTNNTITYLGLKFPTLLRLGIRPVGMTAMLSFTNGRLCDAIYSSNALIWGSELPWRKDTRQTQLQVIQLTAETKLTTRQERPPNENYSIQYYETMLSGVAYAGAHIGLRAQITPQATPTEIKHALAFDFSCFTSLTGCRAFCQMMPLVSKDALDRHRTEGLSIPERELNFAGCSSVYHR